METLPSVGPRLDSAALDESIYSAQSFAKPSPFHAVGTADEHFEGAEAASRDWGSPLSEPGSPRGTFAAKTEANSAIAGGGGGGGSGTVQAKVCIYIPRWSSILAMIGDSTIVRFFCVVLSLRLLQVLTLYINTALIGGSVYGCALFLCCFVSTARFQSFSFACGEYAGLSTMV